MFSAVLCVTITPVAFVDPLGLEFSFEDEYSKNKFEEYAEQINSGSVTGASLLAFLENSEFEIKVVFIDACGKSVYDGKDKVTIRSIRPGESQIMSDDEQMATLIHELTHVYTQETNYNSIVENSYEILPKMYDGTVKPVGIRKQYSEAAAMTVEAVFREEMGFAARNPEYGSIGIENGSYGFFPQDVLRNPSGANNPYKECFQPSNISIERRPTLRMTTLIALDIRIKAMEVEK